MLYQFYEMGQASFKPARLASGFYRSAFSHPLNPLAQTPFMKNISAGLEVFEDLTNKYEKPEWGLDNVIKGLSPLKFGTEVESDFCNLISIAHQDTATGSRPRVLVVAPLSGHYATLLRDTVAALVPDFDVYITDWKNSRDIPKNCGSFRLSDYVDLILRFMEYLGSSYHVLAVCQPGPAVLAATAIAEEDDRDWKPKSITLMGSPIDTRRSPTKPNLFAKSRPLKWFENRLLAEVPANYCGFGRSVYPGFLQLTSFLNMNLGRHVIAYKDFYKSLVNGDEVSAETHRAFYKEYLAVMDLPAEYYLDTLKIVFQEHLLADGKLFLNGRKIDLKAIRDCFLMTVEGENDDISGIGQTQAAHELCVNLSPDRRRDHVQKGVGHYGVFSGARWRSEIAPQIKEFILLANS